MNFRVRMLLKGLVKAGLFSFVKRRKSCKAITKKEKEQILHKEKEKENTLQQAMLPLRPRLGKKNLKVPKREHEQNLRDKKKIN